ncbi:hydrophobic surface binding protein [Roridomyces roridus]|uniref:Hydrophobic surface binding protein n=1 Tax=Roridomyces roridus TaxID=1738132 RepID=A0AAD7FKA2_9AGAR|nr:hydrophobic surface binding protein [Roridomyces roridus]
MVQLSRFFFAASLVLASFATPTKRTVAQVEADIATITTQVNSLNSSINAFPASGLVGALGINTASGNLNTAVQQGTTDGTTPQPVSEADGTTILNSVQAVQPTILQALTAIATKKAAFAALPIAGIPALVLQDLQALNTSTVAFAASLIAAAPADLKAKATAIESAIVSAFATAIAAYE